MSSCLSGGRTYRFDPEIPSLLCSIPRTPSSSSNRSQSSSSSSFSESSNSPLAISTKKSRTPRKRPNQIYTEAAALLSTIYPNIFSTKNFKSICNKHTKAFKCFDESSSELLPPFPAIADSGFLLHPPEKPAIRIEPKPAISCRSPAEDQSKTNLRQSFPVEFEDGFDTESLLDQETEQGIDSIIGTSSSGKDYDSNDDYEKSWVYDNLNVGPGGLYFGGNSGFEFEFAGKFKALRHVDDVDWCRFPTVDILEIMPKLKVSEKEEKEKLRQGLCLKLNYDEVLSDWSDRGSPFSDDVSATGSPESSSDTIARLMQLDLFSELGNWRQQMDENGVREASVLRYKEKRRTRLFSKKIRYQVRKVNADRRPRMKGRFVRRPPLQH